MPIEGVRAVCRALPGVSEDITWGNDLVFSVGGKMFAVVDLEPPNGVAFKCAPDMFAELVERDGSAAVPDLARGNVGERGRDRRGSRSAETGTLLK